MVGKLGSCRREATVPQTIAPGGRLRRLRPQTTRKKKPWRRARASGGDLRTEPTRKVRQIGHIRYDHADTGKFRGLHEK